MRIFPKKITLFVVKAKLMYRYYLIIMFICLTVMSVDLTGQQNDSEYNFKGVKGDTIHFNIISNNTPQILKVVDNGKLETDYLGSNVYSFQYISDQAFVGLDKTVIQYYGDSAVPGLWPTHYTEVSFLMGNSIITAKDDFIDVQSTSFTLNPLGNDELSIHEVNLAGIANQKNIISYIHSVDTIAVNEVIDTERLGLIQYIVEDSLGTSSLGLIKVRHSDYVPLDTIYQYLETGESYEITLKNESYSYNLPLYGSLELQGQGRYKYISSVEGVDTLVFNNGLEDYHIILNSRDLDDGLAFVSDDLAYVMVGEEMIIDVTENDILDDAFIVSYSPQLMVISPGIFSYAPFPWETGYKVFEYTAYNGFEHQSANIVLKIDEFAPRVSEIYRFETSKNLSYFIDYDVPVSEYEYSIASVPAHGQLFIEGHSAVIDSDCGYYDSNYSIEYRPNPNYFGEDYFELRFCGNISNACRVVKVNMSIDNEEESCDCIANDCVWSGDSNNDGVVDEFDLLPLGYCIGSTGSSRDISNDWQGTYSDDWLQDFMASSVNAKYVDANGDGVLNFDDVSLINQNFGQTHNIISDEAPDLSNIPLSFVPRSTVVDSGDWLLVDIVLGNEQNLISDIQGISFQLNIPHYLIDSSSLFIDYDQNGWFTNQSPTLETTFQPIEGQIHTSFTRTGNQGVIGEGIIGTLGFIVEDELNGFRIGEDQEYFDFEIRSTNVRSMDINGNSIGLESSKSTVSLRLDSSSESDENDDELILYPNPASSQVTIFNNSDRLVESIVVFDIMGKLVKSNSFSDESIQSYFIIDIDELPTGLYIVQIQSNDGYTYSSRLEVIK